MSPLAESEEDKQLLEAEVGQLEDKNRKLEDKISDLEGNSKTQKRDADALKDDNKVLTFLYNVLCN